MKARLAMRAVTMRGEEMRPGGVTRARFGAVRVLRESRRGSMRKRTMDHLPDARDGLTRAERVILWQLSLLQKERRDRNVSTAMLYGRVVEHVDLSVSEFQRLLNRMVGKI